MTETSAPHAPTPERIDADTAMRMLQQGGEPVAPHVAARLCAALAGDTAAILQVSASLSAAQRSGLSALPDPLPPVPAVRHLIGAAIEVLSPIERRLLLASAVSVDARVDIALAATGLTMSDALSGELPSFIDFAAGRLTVTDPRVRIYIHGMASLGERTELHAAMATAYADAGALGLSTWHRSLSTLEGDASLLDDLLALAESARRSGAAEWAHSVAREAASHATEGDRLRAHVVAGSAALDAGLIEDAVMWLRAPVSGNDDVAASALAPFAAATALRDGTVPDSEIARLVAGVLSGEHASAAKTRDLCAALATAATLHAERGHAGDALAMLECAERLVGAFDDPPAVLADARACCALFGIRPAQVTDTAPRTERSSSFGRLARAIRLAQTDLTEQALGTLTSGAGTTLGEASPTPPSDRERPAPLREAHRRVAIALVLCWEGNLTRARAELAAAAREVPVALVWAGLAVALARRLDTCTDGITSATTAALGCTHPTPQARTTRTGVLIDRAISAYLDGKLTESGTLLSLATDDAMSATATALTLPGLDEPSVWALSGRPGEALLSSERGSGASRGAPASGQRAAHARVLVACAPPAQTVTACQEAAAVSRGLLSPFERGCTEMLIGRVLAAHGDLDAARSHLLAASGLLHSAGAFVWQKACDRDLDLLPAESPVSLLTSPITVRRPGASDASVPPISRAASSTGDATDDLISRTCHGAWGDILTERELDVALLVTQGRSNREVAARLFVSVRTVEVHLGRIFTKLGVPSRVALTVSAHRLARESEFLAS